VRPLIKGMLARKPTSAGVPQDYAEAVKWYGKAAEEGSAEGQYNLV
jgi:TPR repeat protein